MLLEASGADGARLPVLEGDGRKQQQARELLALLFPQGLTFLQLPFKAEWAESSTRLSRIAADGLGPRLRSLVGEEFLSTLETVHDAYGKALGITAKTTRPPATALPSLREPLGAFLDTLRVYVVKVTALEEPDDEESNARVAQLLEPLRTFPARRRGRAPAEEPPDENRDGGDAAG